jgi:hypothetical protein
MTDISYSFVTATTTAYLTVRGVDVEVNEEADFGDEDEEDYDACPAPEPECTSPDCLRTSWLDEIKTIASSDLSSACSCLVEPSTTTTTLATTGSEVVRIASVCSLPIIQVTSHTNLTDHLHCSPLCSQPQPTI